LKKKKRKDGIVFYQSVNELKMSQTDDYLTMEFLNDLEIFDYDTFVREYKEKPKPIPKKIEVFCAEYDPASNTKEFECAICIENHLEINSVVLNCKHRFCYDCVSSYLKHNNNNNTLKKSPCCALCREEYTTMEFPDYNHLLELHEMMHLQSFTCTL
jgi:hypothetical protein